MVWIAGGDQSNYVNYWTNTPVQAALNQHIAAGRPIGGTSAGLAVLTQFVYSALGSQGITSAEALADPFNRYNTFAQDFLYVEHLQGAIGVSEETALLINERGIGEVVGNNSAYFITAPGAPQVCAPGLPRRARFRTRSPRTAAC